MSAQFPASFTKCCVLHKHIPPPHPLSQWRLFVPSELRCVLQAAAASAPSAVAATPLVCTCICVCVCVRVCVHVCVRVHIIVCHVYCLCVCDLLL